MKHVKKDCGIHSGLKPGPCSKCKYFQRLNADPKYRAGLQYGGTPWVAIFSGDVHAKAS